MWLVDADKLLKIFIQKESSYKQLCRDGHAPIECYLEYKSVCKTIAEEQGIEAIDVVRCKECENWVGDADVHYQWGECRADHCKMKGEMTSEDWYCADGKRGVIRRKRSNPLPEEETSKETLTESTEKPVERFSTVFSYVVEDGVIKRVSSPEENEEK